VSARPLYGSTAALAELTDHRQHHHRCIPVDFTSAASTRGCRCHENIVVLNFLRFLPPQLPPSGPRHQSFSAEDSATFETAESASIRPRSPPPGSPPRSTPMTAPGHRSSRLLTWSSALPGDQRVEPVSWLKRLDAQSLVLPGGKKPVDVAPHRRCSWISASRPTRRAPPTSSSRGGRCRLQLTGAYKGRAALLIHDSALGRLKDGESTAPSTGPVASSSECHPAWKFDAFALPVSPSSRRALQPRRVVGKHRPAAMR